MSLGFYYKFTRQILTKAGGLEHPSEVFISL